MTNIHRTGREWVTWTLGGTNIPPGDYEVSFDNGYTWGGMERDGNSIRVLIEGPEAPDGPVPGTLTLTESGRYSALLRSKDYPEVIVRFGGTVAIAG